MSYSGPRKIIDVHCGWGATPSAPQWNDIASVRAELTERGVTMAFVSSLLARRYDLPTGNDALAASLAAATDAETPTLRGWLVIHPARVVESNQQMRKHLFQDDFVGAALYSDPLTGAPVTYRGVADLVNSFRRYSKPLLVEANTAAAMEQVVVMAEALSGLRIIASGMGGDEWRDALALAARPLNLFLDISGSLVPEKIEYAVETFNGTRKLLFGSGAPYTDPAAIMGLLQDSGLSAEERERILYVNAERLFQIGPPADATVRLSPMAGPPTEQQNAAASHLHEMTTREDPPSTP